MQRCLKDNLKIEATKQHGRKFAEIHGKMPRKLKQKVHWYESWKTKAYRLSFPISNHSKATFQDQKAEVSAFVLVVSGVLEEVNKVQFDDFFWQNML